MHPSAHLPAARRSLSALAAGAVLVTFAACNTPPAGSAAEPLRVDGAAVAALDTTVVATFEAAGTANPLQQATLGTRLMATVTAVLVAEGDQVAPGQVLLRLDARDLAAKERHVAASVAAAEAVHRDALAQATRIRALYNDSAATRAQLDAVESALARAVAGVDAANAAAGELDAVMSHAAVRAPFSGTVIRRHVDPGALAAPGASLVTLQDVSQLRISASAPPDAVQMISRGDTITATIGDVATRAIVEGVVPRAGTALYTINALVRNPATAGGGRTFLAGSTAALMLPVGERAVVVVPRAAVVREGDLTGVTVRTSGGDVFRWVRLGAVYTDRVEVTAGVRGGETVVVPATTTHTAQAAR